MAIEFPKSYGDELDLLCINTVRTLAMDAVEKANSGHPGAPMGLAPAAYVLWTRHLKHNPADPDWFDRDRFILSAGHASMLLYSLLHLTGYDVTIDDLKSFRQWKSRTPGHPEHGITPGVETTTGPLGQGFGNGVGMAMAERYLAGMFNKPGFDIIDHYTYAICSDGDLMEGISHESASLAGHLELGKLIYLYDSNRISIDGSTDLAFTEDVGRRFEGYKWHVQRVDDGNELDAVDSAIKEAQSDPRPSLIVTRTHIGFGAPTKQDSAASHGAALGPEEVAGAKRNLGWDPDKHFFVPDESLKRWREATGKGEEAQSEWKGLFDKYRAEYPSEAAELERIIRRELPAGWDADLPVYTPEDGGIATRKASGKALNALIKKVPELLGGSADLTESNSTEVSGGGVFSATENGRNIHFGVREHGMGAAMNGMALHHLRIFGGTFLIFSDYMRPAVRLAALTEIPMICVWTHDSVGLGEDGPTHQPIEHLAALRAMPNLFVLRPGDANETSEAWRFAVSHQDGPVGLCLTRQNLPVLDRSRLGAASGVARGAYVLYDAPGNDGQGIELIIIGTGSELFVALEAGEALASEGVRTRVVSMPSWELFEEQSQEYRDSILPPGVRARVSVEAAGLQGWEKWVGPDGEAIGLNRFGASAPGDTVLKELGFNKDNVVNRARAVMERVRAREPAAAGEAM